MRRYLLALLLLFALPVHAGGNWFKSANGTMIRIEIQKDPFRAVVTEDVFGVSTFKAVKIGDDSVLFRCEKIRMDLFMPMNCRSALFVSTTSGAQEYYELALPTVVSGGGVPWVDAPRRDKCYTCHGFLTCPVCSGTGHQITYGLGNKLCSACGGSGQCYHCHGTGLQ